MIRSMTAYARKELSQSWGNASWEIRSVNQRYLETYIRLPEPFRALEPIIREKLRNRLTRGKIECTLRFDLDSSAQHQELSLNKDLANQILTAVDWVRTEYSTADINPIELLRWPGVISTKEQNLDEISKEILNLLDNTIDEFINVREREGKALEELISKRLIAILDEVNKIRVRMPDILNWQKERLLNRLEECQIELDSARLEQEIVMLAQRIDVEEELDRLTMHVNELHAILKKSEAVGRRLDFMMQECNRESNTIASKSINADVTASAIELKVLIEQIREQVQNIE